MILTITTPDGFSVSFALTQADASSLATSLGQADPAAEPEPACIYN